MNQNWPTRDEDLQIARGIIENYANKKDSNALGLFEIEVNTTEKRMDFCLSEWVIQLAEQFVLLYGVVEGHLITRRVISCCLTQGETIH